MRGLLIFGSMSVFGAVGWWAAEPLGLVAAFIISTVLSGVGLYAGRRLIDFLAL